jgi:hypothetical protein
MIHPLFTTLATQPALLAEHASAYAQLAAVEARSFGSAWQRRALLLLAAASCALLGLIFTGVALLLCALSPASAMAAPWLLWLVPAVPLLIAAVCAAIARRAPERPLFADLRQQMALDAQLLAQVNQRPDSR